jgi:hypothetical protein
MVDPAKGYAVPALAQGGWVKSFSDGRPTVKRDSWRRDSTAAQAASMAVSVAARSHFGPTTADGYHAIIAVVAAYPGLLVAVASNGEVSDWSSKLLDKQVISSWATGLCKGNCEANRRLYLGLGLPFELEVWAAIGHAHRIRKGELIAPIIQSSKETSGDNPKFKGGLCNLAALRIY